LRLPGHQGCFLSHVLLWERIARGDVPFATIFEDDVLFHPAWRWLAPEYLRRTPPDWDVVDLGHHAFRDMGTAWAAHVPAQSTAAYMVTRAGAAALARAIRSHSVVGRSTRQSPEQASILSGDRDSRRTPPQCVLIGNHRGQACSPPGSLERRPDHLASTVQTLRVAG
jgi:hypothetical protein